MKTFKEFFESLNEDGVAVTTTANVSMPPTIMTKSPLRRKDTTIQSSGKKATTLAELKKLYNNGYRIPSLLNGTYQQYVIEFNKTGALYMSDDESEDTTDTETDSESDGGE